MLQLQEGQQTIITTQARIKSNFSHALELLSILLLSPVPAFVPLASTTPSSPHPSTDFAPSDIAEH